MDVYFITGASKGIGLALSKELLNENHLLVCVARTKNESLIELAKEKNCSLTFLTYDLSEISKLDALMKEMVTQIPENAESVTLINNAGVIEPIGRVEDVAAEDVARSITINLTAPMILTSAFIKELKNKPLIKKVVNISSGAGRKEYSGWSSYCTGKAGLDHFSKVVAYEQKKERNGVKVISIAPGIIDTGMQEVIRSSKKENFELIDQFIDYKELGLLSSPEDTARNLVRVMNTDQFNELDVILDLRDVSFM